MVGMSMTSCGDFLDIYPLTMVYEDNYWNGIRQIIVYKGLLAKFFQNEDIKKLLKSTERALLAECAVKDCIWGIGLSIKDPNRFDMNKWKGQNLLGYTLMMVRECLCMENINLYIKNTDL